MSEHIRNLIHHSMKKLLILTSCLVCVLLLSAACGIEISKGPGDEKAASYLLCKYYWSREYHDGHVKIKQQFRFEADGTGSEVIWREDSGSRAYDFTWSWADSSYRTLALKYPASILLMQEVFITSIDFSCVMEGEKTVFGYDLNMLY